MPSPSLVLTGATGPVQTLAFAPLANLVVGGDTLLGLCRAAGVQALLAQPAVRPGWGCARLQGGAWDGVPCYSRSGAFGGADDLLAMIRLLKGSDNSRKGN